MNCTDIYEKVYFEDNYSAQFAAFRQRYHGRTQAALSGRKVDHAPVPNATTIVHLHDAPDGGYYITTGDFVEYFNRRFGDNDRIGMMRRRLSRSVRKAETVEKNKKQGKKTGTKTEQVFRPVRSVRSGFSLLNAAFALLLVLAIGIFGATTLLLGQTEAELLALEQEVALLEASHDVVRVDQFDNGVIEEVAEYPELSGEDHVEIYPAQKNGSVEMAALLEALASLGK